MKLRHAAALALVGWLMMTPPTARDGKILYNAPLADWEHERGGDTEAQCRANIENLLRGIKKAYPDSLKEEKWQAVRAAKCISTDDPRLKKK